MKPVLFVSARRAPKRDVSGKELQNECVGVFSLDVAEGTKGAHHYSGVINGKPWEKWQREAGVIRGHIRWVDVQKKKFGTELCIYVENEKALYRIEFPYDTAHLKQVGNYLWGMKDQLCGSFWNIHYNVWAKKNADKSPKLTKKGLQAWGNALNIPDAPVWKEWKEELPAYLKSKGLDWEQKYDAQKDENEFDSSKEMTFWLGVIAATQKHLLATCADVVTPFTYDSVLATTNPHPLGVKTMDEGEVATCKNIYESIRDQYAMPFKRNVEDADDAFFESEANEHAERVAAISTPSAPRSNVDDLPEWEAKGNPDFPSDAPPVDPAVDALAGDEAFPPEWDN